MPRWCNDGRCDDELLSWGCKLETSFLHLLWLGADMALRQIDFRAVDGYVAEYAAF